MNKSFAIDTFFSVVEPNALAVTSIDGLSRSKGTYAKCTLVLETA